MTFNLIDQSRQKGSIFSLMLFKYGPNATDVYGYTTDEQPYTYNDVIYAPIPITVPNLVSVTTGGRDSDLRIEVPDDAEVVQLFRYSTPPAPVSLTMMLVHRTDVDSEVRIVRSAVVAAVRPKPEERRAEMLIKWLGDLEGSVGAVRHYQYACPHVLYGAECKAPKAAATVNTTVSSVSGRVVTPPPGWTSPAMYAKYANGSISWTGPRGVEYRAIASVSGGGSISLVERPRDLVPGTAIAVSFGCNRLMSDCRSVHNNIQNFGGQAYIPEDNPIGKNVY